MNGSAPIQAIAVLPGTHLETISAVARASALSLPDLEAMPQPWDAWLAGSFTKSVRRISKPSRIEHLMSLPAFRARSQVGGAIALAFAPMTYDDMPAPLRRLQVSGLDVDRSLDADPSRLCSRIGSVRPTPRVSINADVPMSTGKAAAQATHALLARQLHLSPAERREDKKRLGLDLVIEPFAGETEGWITIRDNGLTEIPAGTATARALLPGVAGT